MHLSHVYHLVSCTSHARNLHVMRPISFLLVGWSHGNRGAPSLRSLSVDICDVGDGCRLDLRPLRHLTRLDLSRSILPGRWDALHGARALRELCFDGDAHVVDEGLVAAVAALPTLRVVCASGRVASNQPLLLFGQLQSMLLARGGRLEL